MSLSLPSRAETHLLLLRSEFTDLRLWTLLIRLDVLSAASLAPPAAEAWLAIARLADSALAKKAEWKAAPSLYVSVVLDQTRALLRAGANADAKRALGTLRSVQTAKHAWHFFKLLAVIEARQSAETARTQQAEYTSQTRSSHPASTPPPTLPPLPPQATRRL
jgi:hypothetical protein